MQTRAERPISAWGVVLCLLVSFAACAPSNAQLQPTPGPLCLGLDAATPTQHLEHALRDPEYGPCVASLAAEQKAACDALPRPAPDDRLAGARQRQCVQLAIIFQDLSVNFRPDAEYRKLAADCAQSGASISCEGAASIQKRMRCMLAMIVGGATDGCMPPLPPFPAKK